MFGKFVQVVKNGFAYLEAKFYPKQVKVSPKQEKVSLPPINSTTYQTDLLCRAREIPRLSENEVKSWSKNGSPKYLSRGGYGSCHIQSMDDDSFVVLKKFKDDARVARDIVNEASMLKLCQGPGVQELIGVCPDTKTLITGYAGRPLSSWVRKPKTVAIMGYTEKPMIDWTRDPEFTDLDGVNTLLQVMKTTSRGLKRKVCHNDLRDCNICVKKPRKGDVTATIIDYGVATEVGGVPYGHIPGFKFHDIAPELFQGARSAENTEIYSIGFLAMLLQPHSPHRTYPKALATWVSNAYSHQPNDRPRLSEGIKLVTNFKRSLARRRRRRRGRVQ